MARYTKPVSKSALPMSKCTSDGYPKAMTLIITQKILQFMEDVFVIIVTYTQKILKCYLKAKHKAMLIHEHCNNPEGFLKNPCEEQIPVARRL